MVSTVSSAPAGKDPLPSHGIPRPLDALVVVQDPSGIEGRPCGIKVIGCVFRQQRPAQEVSCQDGVGTPVSYLPVTVILYQFGGALDGFFNGRGAIAECRHLYTQVLIVERFISGGLRSRSEEPKVLVDMSNS